MLNLYKDQGRLEVSFVDLSDPLGRVTAVVLGDELDGDRPAFAIASGVSDGTMELAIIELPYPR